MCTLLHTRPSTNKKNTSGWFEYLRISFGKGSCFVQTSFPYKCQGSCFHLKNNNCSLNPILNGFFRIFPVVVAEAQSFYYGFRNAKFSNSHSWQSGPVCSLRFG